MSLVDSLQNWAVGLPTGLDVIAGELVRLLLSDAGFASVDMLVTQPGLWVRNALIHAAAGFVAFFWKHHWPRAAAWLDWVFNGYLALQVVQTFLTPGSFPILALDAVFDVAVVAVGYFAAWFIAMRNLPRKAVSR